MSVLVWIVVLVALLAALARVELSFKQWLLPVGTGLLLLTFSGITPVVFSVLAWAVFVVVASVFGIPALRKRWLSKPALAYVKSILPPMSETERTAIEAGTVWWEAELFSGNPDFKNLLANPRPQLSPREQAFIDGPVEQLCRMIDDWEMTHELGRIPDHVWEFMKRERFFGMIIPESYGGLEFSALAHSSVVMKISSRSVSSAVTVMVPNSLGPAELLLHYGTEAQKNYYLPRLAIGEDIPCFALTGPDAGSDAGAIPDYGVVCKGQYEGEDVLGLRLNWEKRYITLGPVATVLGLAFKVYDPDHLIGDQEALGVTCALIPTTTPGVEIGHRHLPLNAVFQNGPNSGHDVFIPMDWVIGGEARIGDGWRMLVESLSAGRGISLPSLSVAAGKHVTRSTGAYARVRKQFHLPIGKFEGVEEALARIGGYTYILDAARTLTTTALDQGEHPSVVSAIVKYHATEMMRDAVDDAMDVHGGRGICMGPSNYLARGYQAIPISITVEGANILTRTLIIFGQGAMRCHPYLLKEMAAAAEPDTNLALENFDAALSGHLGYTVKNIARSFTFGWSGGRLAATPNPDISVAPYYQKLARFSSSLSMTADFALLILGGGLKRKEKLSGRFADVLSYLYLGSAVMKRYEDDDRPVEDLALVQWSMDHLLFKTQEALDGIIRHFPLKPVCWMLRAMVFPLGRRLNPPADHLGHLISQLMMTPGETRDRLIDGIFYTQDKDDPTGRVEHALMLTLQVEPLEKRLREAGVTRKYSEEYEDWVHRLQHENIINNEEAQLLLTAHQAIRNAIMVDDFPQEFAVASMQQDKAA
ncbi:MAG TPA: acyl-CoA dehydrogenase [Gammaproteobacteria bacterium]|nr:acyl-CoA dehydrogenase [Gammaproteobacteria bacterium]